MLCCQGLGIPEAYKTLLWLLWTGKSTPLRSLKLRWSNLLPPLLLIRFYWPVSDMKFGLITPLILALGLATDAHRFVHRSTPTPPPSCVAKERLPATSGTGGPSIPPGSSTRRGSPVSTSVANATAIETTSIPLTSDSIIIGSNATVSTNDTLPTKRFGGFIFSPFLLSWQDLCLRSGGEILDVDSPCITLGGFQSIGALLADANPCAQQDVADAMITFAKRKGVINREELISFAVAYRKHPRDAVRILGIIPATPYCLRAPINQELIGVVNEQLEGVMIGLYGGPHYPIIKFGERGSCPFGAVPNVASCSCVNAKRKVTSQGTSSSSNGPMTGTDTNSTTVDTPAQRNTTDSGPSAASNSSSSDSTGIDAGETDTESGRASSEADSAGNSPPIIGDGGSPSDTSTSTAISQASTSTSSKADSSEDGGFDGDVNDPNGR
ncbi:hypothetical protein PQX77_001509 [Marasmius sp. AFHP31]|nr:hypothetical protein PQX77_001509 [Marasmius sp. AFHP31]